MEKFDKRLIHSRVVKGYPEYLSTLECAVCGSKAPCTCTDAMFKVPIKMIFKEPAIKFVHKKHVCKPVGKPVSKKNKSMVKSVRKQKRKKAEFVTNNGPFNPDEKLIIKAVQRKKDKRSKVHFMVFQGSENKTLNGVSLDHIPFKESDIIAGIIDPKSICSNCLHMLTPMIDKDMDIEPIHKIALNMIIKQNGESK
jgi:hypothetical protein